MNFVKQNLNRKMLRKLACLTVFCCILSSRIFVETVVIKVENLAENCGYSKCPKWDPNKINVHLVAHTHNDVGWLKTVEQYYYGTRSNIQKASVELILDSVIQELIRNKDRKFIYVETAFFWKWWKLQNEDMRSVVKELVRTGQLEFINGGWSMPDEATTHYNSLIDQSTWGLRRLNDTFGKCGQPRVTWQIDPFGHSKELASLFAQMGYDALFFARQDYQDREHRMKNKTLEHVWQGSQDLGTDADLFTGMMMSGYGPIEFNWDLVGGLEDPIVDDDSEEYNADKMVDRLVEHAKLFAKYYATKNVMFPMGTDFQFQGAHNWYRNLDKLIKHVNERKDVQAFYSTPSCYAKALHESNRTWSGKVDDYFPYASDPHAYWTGYFTSRPALKRMERFGNNILQACKQIDVLANNGNEFQDKITALREQMGVMQHHDAVSGTEKQEVQNNYARHLSDGILKCERVISKSIARLMPENKEMDFDFCNSLNISTCYQTEWQSFMVIYNPLGHALNNHTIRVPVRDGLYYQVVGPNNVSVPSVLVPIPEYILNLPTRKWTSNETKKEIVFRVNLKPLGLSKYSLIVTKQKTPYTAEDADSIRINSGFTLHSKNLTVKFDSFGQIVSVKQNPFKEIPFQQGFHYYEPYFASYRSSGAYIFRPNGEKTKPVISESELKKTEAILYIDRKHNLVQEVHQKYKNSYIDQVIKIDPLKDQIEFEFGVGPIPIADGGKEIVARYSLNISNPLGKFYTDSNGRQLLERRWNYRPQWNYRVEEPVSGNYYPVNSRIAIKDENLDLEMMILTDRSQGGSLSPTHNASIDLMVHRRLLFDDDFGVDEALNEPGADGKGLRIRAKHIVLFDKINQIAKRHRPLAQQMFMEPIIAFADFNKDLLKTSEFVGLNKELPRNVHLLTLERWHSNSYLLRLEHFYQRNEDPELSRPATVSLKNLFKNFTVKNVRELTLGANQDADALKKRLVFKYKPEKSANDDVDQDRIQLKHEIDQNFNIKLQPMEIRTFLIDVVRQN